MSHPLGAFYDTADLIKARMERLVMMDGVEVIVDQQKQISVQIATAVAQLKGCATILFLGADPAGESSGLWDADYAVRIYGAPVLRPDGVPVERLTQECVMGLNGWNPDLFPDCYYDFKVTGRIELLPDETYVIYEFPVRRRVLLPKPELKPLTPPPTDP